MMNRKTKWPSSKTPVITRLIKLIRARNKAIKHSVRSMDLDISLDVEDGIEYEHLIIKVVLLSAQFRTVTINVWQDCAYQVDVRERSKEGWTFEYVHEGFDDSCVFTSFLDKVEKTIAIATSRKLDQNSGKGLQEIWLE